MTQWLVAGLKPPSLKAMIPWEGAADMYRDFGYHGGIFSFTFVVNWYNNHMAHHLLGKPQATSPDAFATPWVWEYMRYNLDGEWYHGRQAAWENIDCPLYSVGNWSGMGLHLRGNTEGYLRAASRHKKLRIHAGTHYHPFYSAEGRRDQLRFFDHWLKGLDTGIMREPPVKLLIRKGGQGNSEWRFENEWPLKRTRWTKFFLRPPARDGDEAAPGALVTQPPRKANSFSYSASGMTKAGVASASWTSTALAGSLPPMGVAFATDPLAEDTEVTGPVVLVLWVASSTEDMDIFATIRNIAPDGSDVFELGQQSQPVPVAKGWLRASHRRLDPALSRPYRPYHCTPQREWLRARRAGACRRRDLADLHGVQEGSSHPARYPAARRRRQRALHALRCRLQLGNEHDIRRRRPRFIPAASDHSAPCLTPAQTVDRLVGFSQQAFEEDPMEIKRIDHYSIRTLDVEASRKFYTEIIGLRVGPRPPFNFPGLWLYSGEPPADLDHAEGNYGIVHVMGVDRDNPQALLDYMGGADPDTQQGNTGALDHIALAVTGRAGMLERCRRSNVSYFERAVPVLGLHQVFIKDPNGLTIELNFPASEAPQVQSATATATA